MSINDQERLKSVRAEKRMLAREMKILTCVECAVRLEEIGGDVLTYIENTGLAGGKPAELVWREWQKKYLDRPSRKFTTGLPKKAWKEPYRDG